MARCCATSEKAARASEKGIVRPQRSLRMRTSRRGIPIMPKRFWIPFTLVAGIFLFSLLVRPQQGEFARQPGAVYDSDKKGEPPMPAPRHDISGIWEPAKTASDVVQATSPRAMPSDGKPEHELRYTALGRKAFLQNKPTFGVTEVVAALTNDP